MAAMDVTNAFKEAVRNAALHQRLDQAKMAKLSESLIMTKTLQRSPFTLAAIETMKNIDMLHTFILMHRKDYVDQHRSTEKDRDDIEHEVGVFVKTCKERIEQLKNSIGMVENESQSGWLSGIVGIKQSADLIAHQHGVVLILSEHLHSVTALFDSFRSVRFKEAIEKTIPRWRKQSQVTETPVTHDDQARRTEDRQPRLQQNQVMLDEETQALQVELTNLLDTVEETERKMIEMSALNHLFSTHVLHQAQQIEMLYHQALEATENYEKGNKELTKAIERTSSSRTFLLLFLIVLPTTLLFLHWYKS